MSATPFDADHALEEVAPGVFARDVDRRWFGWAGLFGGYVLGLAVEAGRRVVADPGRHLRSLTLHFLRPFPHGRFVAAVAVERAGRSVTSLSVRCEVDGRLCGIGLLTFGADRDAGPLVGVRPPLVDPFDPAGDELTQLAFIPAMERLHLWHATGLDDDDTGYRRAAWVRLREPGGADERFVVAAGDAVPPTIFGRLGQPAAGGTMDFTAHLRAPVPAEVVAGAVPVLVVLTTRALLDGYVDEDAEIWTPDGRLLAQTRQLRYLQRATADTPLS